MRRSILIPLSLLALAAITPLCYGSVASNRAFAASDATVPFTDDVYHFALSYPQGDAVHVYAERDVARTITFESEANPAESFQVYVQPYQASSITPDQFRTDDPSGVMLEPATTTIDGVSAKSFTGYNDQMGTTSEVWFIHGGYLYEVTTYQQSVEWLTDVLSSWHFI